MALKQRRKCIQSLKAFNNVQPSLRALLEQENNTHFVCNSRKLENPSEMVCSACLEVQHINEYQSTNAKNSPSVSISPTLTRSAASTDDEVIALSPVLGKRFSEETSPILVHGSTSPVIGNYSLRKRTKQSTPTNCVDLKIEQVSPEVFCTQTSTSYTINNDDNSDQSESPLKITQILTQNDEKVTRIELVPSDDESKSSGTKVFSLSERLSSSECSYSISCETTSSGVSDNNTGNTVQSFCKRKRYKKNGLAKRLQKCISYKNSSVAMWLHEQRFSKYSTENDTSHTHILRVTDFWEECNNFVMYCNSILENNGENSDCIVIIGINNINGFVPYKNTKFFLYTPYITKLINYNSKLLKCFCNISRIKACDESTRK